eukprot:gene5728-7125_t
MSDPLHHRTPLNSITNTAPRQSLLRKPVQIKESKLDLTRFSLSSENIAPLKQSTTTNSLSSSTIGISPTNVVKKKVDAPKASLKKPTPATAKISQAKQSTKINGNSQLRKPVMFEKSKITFKDGLSVDKLQQSIGKLDSFTQSVHGNLKFQLNNLTESYKPPRLSLAPSEIKTRLDIEEKDKEIDQLKKFLLELKKEIQNSNSNCEEFKSTMDQMKLENELHQEKNLQLNQTITTLQSNIIELSSQVLQSNENQAQLKNLLVDRESIIQRLTKENKDKDECIAKKNREIDELEEKGRKDEATRKMLHNLVQELKGNIRVFCRIRPNLNQQQKEDIYVLPGQEAENSIEVNVPGSTVTGVQSSKKLNFSFDKVFGPSANQSMVFEEISQLVQSALDGYNTCIFTYGQTGSGKTWTMEGSQTHPDNRGMIPRTVEKIFATSESLKPKGWTYEMEACFLEIYNETINDLLNPKADSATKYDIKHEGNTTSVTNLTMSKVNHPREVYELLSLAARTRSVAKTLSNERSSRSHSVFQLKLFGYNSISGEKTQGILNLIDLAGSERINKSGVSGDRLKETQAINKSLSSLSDVISALANKEQHVPFRNSKLTYLLQNSLGGNSKTLMFVNISPELKDVNETVSSLRFATKVNSCEIGTARKQSKIDLN